jgi:hypothetical protein
MIDLLRRGLEEAATVDAVVEALRPHAGDVSDADLERLATEMASFIRGVPDALDAALAASKDERCGRPVTFATGSILHYLFDEEDLFAERSFGVVGLLDDAYLLHAFVALVAQAYPFLELHASYTPPDERAFQVVATALPDGVPQALVRTCESTLHVAAALFPTRWEGASAGEGPPQRLRLAEAAGRLGELAAAAQADQPGRTSPDS